MADPRQARRIETVDEDLEIPGRNLARNPAPRRRQAHHLDSRIPQCQHDRQSVTDPRIRINDQLLHHCRLHPKPDRICDPMADRS